MTLLSANQNAYIFRANDKDQYYLYEVPFCYKNTVYALSTKSPYAF